MRIKKLAAVTAMAVTMMGVGTAAQALTVDAMPELGFVGAVLEGVGDFLDEETDELVTDVDSPVRDLATDDDSRVDDIIDGLLTSDDAVVLDDVEDALCIVFDGDTDCDDNDGLLGNVLPNLLGEDGILAIVGLGVGVGLF